MVMLVARAATGWANRPMARTRLAADSVSTRDRDRPRWKTDPLVTIVALNEVLDASSPPPHFRESRGRKRLLRTPSTTTALDVRRLQPIALSAEVPKNRGPVPNSVPKVRSWCNRRANNTGLVASAGRSLLRFRPL